MPKPAPKAILCPYCGSISKDVSRCVECGGRFDHLSRQATQNSMGPWHIRDERDPFRPGCSYDTLKKLVAKGRVTEATVLRGPTTRQFWSPAKRAPSVANLFGLCHGCQCKVAPDDLACPRCGASFEPETDRQYLGLMPVRLLPGQAPAEAVAASTYESPIDEHDDFEQDQGHDAARPSPSVAGVRFQHSMSDQVLDEDVGGAFSGMELSSDGGGRGAWLILAVVLALLCLGTAAGIVVLAPKLGLDMPSWAAGRSPVDEAEAPTPPDSESEATMTTGEWDGLVRPGIDAGRERDEAVSRRRSASEQAVEDATGEQIDEAEPFDGVDRVRALIAAGDTESLGLAREMVRDVPEPQREILEQAISRLESLLRISDIL